MSAWFTGLQFNNGMAKETKGGSSFMLSLIGTANQLGMALGSNLAVITINVTGMQNIVYITLLSGVSFLLIQLKSLIKLDRKIIDL